MCEKCKELELKIEKQNQVIAKQKQLITEYEDIIRKEKEVIDMLRPKYGIDLKEE
jgi:uncharacterized coiled-coil protein SlyX